MESFFSVDGANEPFTSADEHINKPDIDKTINYDVLKLNKNKIEAMDQYSQLEILNILMNDKCKINENKSGVFVNLSLLNDETINKIIDYVAYREHQEETFNTFENKKQEYQNALKN